MTFIDFLSKRDKHIIENKYYIIDYSEEFNIVIYFLEENKCQIIIRKIDFPSGWNNNLLVKIQEFNSNNFEILSCGSSIKNSKIINIDTFIKLKKSELIIQKIPKVIIQTTKSKNINNILHLNSIYSFIDFNPDYDYILFDDNDCRLFIKENFDVDTLKAFDILVPGSFKADLFRYCYLYINGGCYFDCKQILRVPLKELIKSDDEFLICKDIGPNCYFNAIILTTKNNQNLFNTIKMCVKKVLNFDAYYSFNDKNFKSRLLSLTGPELFYDAIHKNINYDNIRFIHKSNTFYNDYKHLFIESNNKIIIYKFFNGYTHTGDGYYPVLWNNNEILFKNYMCINDFKFLIYPNKFYDAFNFYIFDENNLIIERIDNKNNGWGHNYNLKIIDDINNSLFSINFGISNNKFKIFNFENDWKKIKFNNKSILSNFEIIENREGDLFNINIVKYNFLYKLIIVRTDGDKGWAQNLKIKFEIINSSKKYYMELGPSSESILIKDFIE